MKTNEYVSNIIDKDKKQGGAKDSALGDATSDWEKRRDRISNLYRL